MGTVAYLDAQNSTHNFDSLTPFLNHAGNFHTSSSQKLMKHSHFALSLFLLVPFFSARADDEAIKVFLRRSLERGEVEGGAAKRELKPAETA